MDTIAWLEGDAAMPVPADQRPQRFALSFVAVPTSPGFVTVVNPHPDSWNTWMFPYGGARLELPAAAQDVASTADLQQVLERLKADYEPDYVAGAAEELRRYFVSPVAPVELRPFFRTFSLKYSKSSNSWTAYIFSYHAATLAVAPDVKQAVVSLEPDSIDSAVAAGGLEGVRFEENVVTLLTRPNLSSML